MRGGDDGGVLVVVMVVVMVVLVWWSSVFDFIQLVRFHCSLGSVYIFLDLIVFVLCASGLC